jgi:hypothetical protein
LSRMLSRICTYFGDTRHSSLCRREVSTWSGFVPSLAISALISAAFAAGSAGTASARIFSSTARLAMFSKVTSLAVWSEVLSHG